MMIRLFCLLYILLITDYKHFLLPIELNLTLLFFSICSAALSIYTNITHALIGAVFGYTVLYVTNFIYNRISSQFPEFSYIITLTHTINKKWSAYIETQDLYLKNRKIFDDIELIFLIKEGSSDNFLSQIDQFFK